MTQVSRWSSGDVVTFDKRVRGRSKVIIPMTVVFDQPNLLALHRPSGTVVLRPVEEEATRSTRVVAETWSVPQVELVLTRPDEAWGIHLVWSLPNWRFMEWYVNLQEPLERTRSGVRMNDHLLDIVVRPDLSWWWKDEDHLALAIADGRMTSSEADTIRAEGERVIADIEAGRWPFDGSHQDWRPDPAWDIPVIPDEWKHEDA